MVQKGNRLEEKEKREVEELETLVLLLLTCQVIAPLFPFPLFLCFSRSIILLFLPPSPTYGGDICALKGGVSERERI